MRLETAVSQVNSSDTPLAYGSTYTGTYEDTTGFISVIVACIADQDGTLYLDFSTDGIVTKSTLSFKVSAGLNEVHRLTITRKYFRARFTNDDPGLSDQASFCLTCTYGMFNQLTSALNSTIQQDADAAVVRAIDFEFDLAAGRVQNTSITNKFGLNSDIDTGTLPEDVWEAGGVYTGFPDSTLETVSLLSSSAADAAAGTGARTVRIMGLDSNYDQISETVTLNGVTPVATTQQFRRVHTATVLSAGSGGVNAGTITVRHTTTTANVFLSMQIGRNQTNSSGYTVPAGYTAYMRRISISMTQSTAAATAEGNIWTRGFGLPYRSRRPFTIGASYRLEDIIYGGLIFTEKSDIVIRINTVSNSNTLVSAGYDLILVKN